MATETKIQWTTHTFNPWRGCTKVSPGCTNCYAETLSNRNPKVLGVWGPKGTRVLAAEAQWLEPVKWNRQAARERAAAEIEASRPRSEYDGLVDYRRPKVFCASLADVFEDWPGQMKNPDGTDVVISNATRVMGRTGTLRGTTEPFTLGHARERLWKVIRETPDLDWQILTKRPERIAANMPAGDWPNVWLGASVESPEYVWRLDALMEATERISVPVLFCSAEPLLAGLDISPALGAGRINWVIVGGESGGGARPFDLAWGRSLVRQCREANVACFVKQVGARPDEGGARLQLLDRKGGAESEWPRDLRVRQFPEDLQ